MLPYQERKRSRVEDILIEQFILHGRVTKCPAGANQERPKRFGHALPPDLDPTRMGEREVIDAARAVREYEADSRLRRRKFEVVAGVEL